MASSVFRTHAEAFLKADFDFTLLVRATPPRHAASKQVILAVTGSLDLSEIDDLEQVAVLRRKNVDRAIFRCPTGRYYELAGPFDPCVFTDTDGGLPFLRQYRKQVSKSIREVPPTLRRAYFYPGSKMEGPDDFGRVPPERSGMVRTEMEGVERERAKVVRELAGYAVMGGSLFRAISEPFLVLRYDHAARKFFLDVEANVLDYHAVGTACLPVACFQLAETKQARAYAARLADNDGGAKPEFRSGGHRVVFASEEKLAVDPRAMTLMALAMRMKGAYQALLEETGDLVRALTTLPIEEIIAFRGLCAAIDEGDNADGIENAVMACVACERKTGRQVFTWDNGPVDNFDTMLEFWSDRPISISFRGEIQAAPSWTPQ